MADEDVTETQSGCRSFLCYFTCLRFDYGTSEMYFSLPTVCYNGDNLAEIPTTALRVNAHQQGLRF